MLIQSLRLSLEQAADDTSKLQKEYDQLKSVKSTLLEQLGESSKQIAQLEAIVRENSDSAASKSNVLFLQQRVKALEQQNMELRGQLEEARNKRSVLPPTISPPKPSPATPSARASSPASPPPPRPAETVSAATPPKVLTDAGAPEASNAAMAVRPSGVKPPSSEGQEGAGSPETSPLPDQEDSAGHARVHHIMEEITHRAEGKKARRKITPGGLTLQRGRRGRVRTPSFNDSDEDTPQAASESETGGGTLHNILGRLAEGEMPASSLPTPTHLAPPPETQTLPWQAPQETASTTAPVAESSVKESSPEVSQYVPTKPKSVWSLLWPFG